MASNPVLPLLSSPADSCRHLLDPIGSEFEDEDEESNHTSHPASPEKLDIVSSSSFVFDPHPHESASPPAVWTQCGSSSPTHYETLCGRDAAANGCLPTGTAVGGTTIVEEQIETIITTEGLSDDGSASHSCSSSSRRNLFPDPDEGLDVQLDLDGPAIRVPFPELGLDLVDVHLLSLFSPEERAATTSSEIRLTELKSWDENWLFKQRKKKSNSVSAYFAFADLDFASEPVRMFIPNPTSQQAKVSVGQQDLEDLTDLSEKNSVASLSFSSDSEESEAEHDTSAERTLPHHQPTIMTQSGLLQNSNHKRIVTEADHKPQSDQQSPSKSCPSDSERGKSLSRGQQSSTAVSSNCLVTTFPSQKSRVEIISGKKSYFAPKSQEKDHEQSSSSSAAISLPSFVPLSRRMESSRCDPCFVIKPRGASVQTAILVQFCCRVKGSRPLGVAWFKGDHLLADSDSFRIFSSGNEFVLEIRCTQLQHTDVYSCVVYNGFGEQWSDFNLTVKERPRSPVITATRSLQTNKPVNNERERRKSQDRGIDIDRFRAGKSPRIVTQTWAERSIVGRDAKEAKAGTVSAIQRESNSNGLAMTGSGSPKREDDDEKRPPVASEKDQSTWRKNPQKSNINHDDGLEKQIPPTQRPVIFSSTARVIGGGGGGSGNDDDDVGRGESESTRLHHPRHDDWHEDAGDDKVDQKNGIVSLSSKCKDLSIYKRDYFVPSSAKDETLNGLDEKVYETSKFFPLQENEKEDGNSSADETSILTAGSPSVSGSLAESYFSQKDSGQGDETTVVDDEDETTDDTEERGGVSPSVKKLVRRFSRKESASGVAKRSTTYSSCSNLYEDCHGKGVMPKSHADFSPEVAFVLTTWNRRNGRSDSISSLYSNCDSETGSRPCSSLATTACSSIYSPTLDRSVSADDRFSVDFVNSIRSASLTVHSPVARSLNKFFRQRNSQTAAQQLNRFGSFSMCDIDQIASPSGAGFSSCSLATGISPTNEGYNSDDSALSGNTSLRDSINNNGLKSMDGSVEVMPTKKVSRTIMKRASFWQNRCEKGLLSDSSVPEEYPGIECIYD